MTNRPDDGGLYTTVEICIEREIHKQDVKLKRERQQYTGNFNGGIKEKHRIYMYINTMRRSLLAE